MFELNVKDSIERIFYLKEQLMSALDLSPISVGEPLVGRLLIISTYNEFEIVRKIYKVEDKDVSYRRGVEENSIVINFTLDNKWDIYHLSDPTKEGYEKILSTLERRERFTNGYQE